MKNEDLYSGITNIKDSIILEADTYTFMKETKSVPHKWLKYALIAAVFSVFVGLAVLAEFTIKKTKTPIENLPGHGATSGENIAQGNPFVPIELQVGFDSGKETTGQYIAYRSLSFVKKGEKLVVNTIVGDESYEYYQKHGNGPCYDNYGITGYPNLQVYLCESNVAHKEISDSKLIVNGKLGKYHKVYAKEEMSSLDISSSRDIACGKPEVIEIDFSGYETGSMGQIALSFSWDFGEDISNYILEKEHTWFGNRTFIGFYVGEEGIAFSGNPEDAKMYYDENFGLSKSKNENMDSSQCSAKDFYLYSDNEFEREYEHGEIVGKRYEFVSSQDVEQIKISLAEHTGVEIYTPDDFIVKPEGKNVFTILFRVTGKDEIGKIDFTVTPMFVDDSLEKYSIHQTIYTYTDGKNDYVSLNSLEGLARYSSEVEEGLKSIDKKGEHKKYIG